MDKLKQVNDEMQKEPIPPKNRNKLVAVLLVLVMLCAIGLGIALWWCLYHHEDKKTGTTTPPVATTSGPCTSGASNDLPAGYSWYENASLGYKFAYPTAWGTVTVATSPTGGVSGHYAQGSFATNHDATFGGNATDYVVNPRDGILTDNPGYLEAYSRFYSVQIWKLHNPGGTDEDKTTLFPITTTTILKNGCNAKAAVTQYPHDDYFGYSYDIARFNLQPTNVYYGVNFILKNPTSAGRADFDKVIQSFQLIP